MLNARECRFLDPCKKWTLGDSDLNGCHSERSELGKTVCDLHKTSHINILKISSRHIIR